MKTSTPTPQKTVELLAPAGNWDCARAAVASGADAIYFGLSRFNARLRADNFTENDLPELMDFLHRNEVKGFVTMNTLVFTDELTAAEKQLRDLAAANVDAIIVQDLGLAQLARHVAPTLDLHASTQMTITSPEGLSFIDQLLHLDRAVLARELSLRELEKFSPRQSVPLEVFVHGALCVAYSGQCLTSESLGQRSANRGECAQACRMPYELVVDGQTLDLADQRYLLSPQDLAAVDLIPQLVELGIRSYKIEGRLKSPEYVTAVTAVYRKALDAALASLPTDQVVTERDRYEMEMTFSRGLTTGWLAGTNHPQLTHGKFGKKRGARIGQITKVGSDWVEIDHLPTFPLSPGQGLVFDAGEDRNHEQGGRIHQVHDRKISFHLKFTQLDFRRIKPGQTLWLTDDPKLNDELRRRWQHADLTGKKIPLDLIVEGQVGQPLTLHLKDSPLILTSQMPLQAARAQPLDTPKLIQQLGRLGKSPFTLNTLTNRLIGQTILPLSELNRLRRELATTLESSPAPASAPKKPSPSSLHDLLPTPPPPSPPAPPILSILVRNLPQLEAALATEIQRVYLDFEDIRRTREAVEVVRHANQTRPHQATEVFLASPRIQKAGEAGHFKVLEKAQPDGILIRNLGALQYFQNHPLRLVGDFSLNVANPLTAQLLMSSTPFESLTASYDLNAPQLEALLKACPPQWFELTLHQHMPMFHMEHCVFCTFMSKGTSFLDCGRPCEKHQVHLRDRVGQLHPLTADVGCRNTLFNGRAQTGARFFKTFHQAGANRFRLELVNESPSETTQIIHAYQALLQGQEFADQLIRRLGALEKLGVTEGNLIPQPS